MKTPLSLCCSRCFFTPDGLIQSSSFSTVTSSVEMGIRPTSIWYLPAYFFKASLFFETAASVDDCEIPCPPAEEPKEKALTKAQRRSLILPIHIHEPCPATRYSVLMIRSCFPGHRAVRCDFNKLKLNRLSGRHTGYQKPIRIVWRQHRPHRAIPRCAPIAQFYRAPR